ncbi:probable cell division topological specificity factor at C-terminar half [Coccomyxa sp. Obi]|nr:probable cell division topological specificity factor at C-terminar half [Coccomyxa sp. Obi]
MASSIQIASAFQGCGTLSGRPVQKVSHLPPLRASRKAQGRCSVQIAASYRETGQPFDVAAAARQKVGAAGADKAPAGGLADFARKLRAAWQIFFPPQPKGISPKEEGKNRLRMILVADRCGMNPASLHDMKHSIVRAVQDYVDIEAEELVEVNISTDVDLGTIYSVAVPIKRVKPVARVPMDDDVEVDGITLRWDSSDPESDPSSEFPYGC